MRVLLFLSLIYFLPDSAMSQKVLFIRGGDGTGGFLEGGQDDQLCNIDDFSIANGNHGWGTLATLLQAEGFELEQIEEGAAGENTPVDLENRNLEEYAILVFGSNNTSYTLAAIDAVEQYIKQGGAALFISDANFGTDWHRAPDSDQQFLDRFGWTMNQDLGTYTVDRENFQEPNHPILNNLEAFDGEGVSPITVINFNIPEVASSILVKVPTNQRVRRNNKVGLGDANSAEDNDAVLVIAEVGLGRIAGHYDRNTFFNQNGAGTDITRNDNRQYAINLFNWLAQKEITSIKSTVQSTPFQIRFNSVLKEVNIVTNHSHFKLQIFDCLGRLHFQNEDQDRIDLSNLSSGIYFLNINQKWSFPIMILP